MGDEGVRARPPEAAPRARPGDGHVRDGARPPASRSCTWIRRSPCRTPATGRCSGRWTAEAIDRFVAAAGPSRARRSLSAEIRHVGGALSRPQPHHGALSTFDADYLTFAVGMVLERGRCTGRTVPQLDRLAEALGPYDNGREYLNFTERPTDPARFYTPAVYRRLREVKGAVRPADVFRANHPIVPA